MRRRYVQDIGVESALHVVTVRSQRASAVVTGVEAPAVPDGAVVLMARDIPGTPYLTWGSRRMPILAATLVRYVGEPVALVAAPDLETAQALAAAVSVHYQDAAPGSAVWEPATETILVQSPPPGPDPAAPDDGLAAGPQLVTMPRRFAPPAPQEAVAYREGQTLVVRTATQHPFHVRDTVADSLGLPRGRVRVLGEALDGPCGKLLMPSLVCAHAALVSWHTGQPARVRYSWREELGVSFRVAGTTGSWECGPPAGPPRARFHLTIEGGAYDLAAQEVLRRVAQTIPGPYHTDSSTLEAHYRFSETTPCDLPPGCGEMEATLLRELWVSADAEARGLDPATWRLMLLGTDGAHHDQGSQDTHTGPAAHERKRTGSRARSHSTDQALRDVIREVVRRSGFYRRQAACAANRERRGDQASIPHRGIGISVACFTPGLAPDEEQGTRVRLIMGRDRRVIVQTSAVDAGRGYRRVLSRVVGEALGVPADMISVAPVDTALNPPSGPTVASRTAAILVPLLRRCCATLKTRIARGAFPATVESRYRPRAAPPPATSVATVASVEVDPETRHVRCTGLWAAVDAGELLDPDQARCVAAAAMLRGLAITTLEQSEAALVPVPPAVDPQAGQAPTYRIAGFADLCPVDVAFLEYGHEAGVPPLGISEAVLLGVPAAVVSAVQQATGRPVTRLPIALGVEPRARDPGIGPLSAGR